MKKDEFICTDCGCTYVKAWTDEESRQEAIKQFGEDPEEGGMRLVCEDCYKLYIGETQLQ